MRISSGFGTEYGGLLFDFELEFEIGWDSIALYSRDARVVEIWIGDRDGNTLLELHGAQADDLAAQILDSWPLARYRWQDAERDAIDKAASEHMGANWWAKHEWELNNVV